MTKITCPNCSIHLETEDDITGQRLKCPSCGFEFSARPVVELKVVSPPSFSFKAGYFLLGFVFNIAGIFLAHAIRGRDAAHYALVGLVSLIAVVTSAILLSHIANLISVI